jgi:hypothetical protein
MIILRTKRFTYIGKTRKDEYTHLLGKIRDEIYDHPNILEEIENDARDLGYQEDDFIREMGIVSRKHVDPDKILLEVKHSRSDKTLVACLSDDNISLIQYKNISEQRLYSGNRQMIDRITKKLDNAGLDDYDVASRIPNDSISITSDLGNLKLYFPYEYEYSQYDIDDFIRGLSGAFKTKTVPDGDIYVMTIYGGRLNEIQYFKLLKYIIEENEFVTILEDDK